MTVSGPPRASAATTAPKIGMKRAAVDGPKTFPTSVAAAIPITRSSNAAQPRSWNTFSAVGMYDPRRPRIGRRLTIVGTPARLPWCAAAASIRLPRTEPKRATTADSARVRPNPKPPTPINSVPAARTRSPIPRLDHRTKRSKVRRTRNPCGTGSTPHSGGLRTRNIERPSPPCIYRIGGRPAAWSLLRRRELPVRMLQRGDERELLSGQEVDEGAPSRAHVIDSVREPQLFDRRDRVSTTDDREAIRFGDRGEQLTRADRERLEFEDARRTVEENRLRAVNLLDVVGDRVQPDVVHGPLRRESGNGDRPSLTLVVEDDVRRPRDSPGESREEFLAHRPVGLVVLDLASHEVGRRRARVDSGGVEEQVRHAARGEHAVDQVFLEHVARDGDRVVRLHAAEERDLRPLGLLDRLGEHRELPLHHPAGEGGEDLAKADEARLRSVGRGERIEDEVVRVRRKPAHDVGLRHLLEFRVCERVFLRVETRVL